VLHPDDPPIVKTEGIGLVAFMVQHKDGQVQLLSWPNAGIRVRGASWDEIWPEFVKRSLEEKV
jgi:hypothetical protein